MGLISRFDVLHKTTWNQITEQLKLIQTQNTTVSKRRYLQPSMPLVLVLGKAYCQHGQINSSIEVRRKNHVGKCLIIHLHYFTDINECLSSPCKNSGVCEDKVGKFWCNCPIGYSPPFCELQKYTGMMYFVLYIITSLT